DYPILITNHEGWQIDALKQTFEQTDFDEIFFLNETMIIKDNNIWPIVFNKYRGNSVQVGKDFQMFLGKYLKEYINKTIFPTVSSRLEDVIFGEDLWNRQYINTNVPIIYYDTIMDRFPH